MDQIRLGVVGCGVIGQYHLRYAAASPLISLVAVADQREVLAERAAREFFVPKCFSSGESLINSGEVNAVVLALPTAMRFSLAKLALETGCHVLLEKPTAMNVGQIKHFLSAQQDLVVASCSSRNRALTSSRVATECVAAGRLGEVRVLHCRSILPADAKSGVVAPAWRRKKSLNGGGILANWGSYDLDYLLGICGWLLVPRLVLGHMWVVAPQILEGDKDECDAETHVAAMICCEDDVVIHYERGESTTSAKSECWQVIGSHGSLKPSFRAAKGNRVILDTYDPSCGVRTEILWEGDETDDTVHAGPVIDFAESILQRRTPRTGLQQALIIQSIIDAIYLSAERGCAVEIDASFDLHTCKV